MTYQTSYLTPQSIWFRPGPSFDATRGYLSALNREIDQVLEGFGSYPSKSGTSSHSSTPRMSVNESDSSVEIETELPGVEEKDVEISLSDDVLTIKGEKRMESSLQHSDYCHQERTFGKFSRSITLPFGPDPKSVKTLFSRGVLKITLPKAAAIKQNAVKIPVKSAGLH